MPQTTSPFSITILPSDDTVVKCNRKGLRLSLCIEINRAHTLFDPEPSGDFAAWAGVIERFHAGNSSLHNILRKWITGPRFRLVGVPEGDDLKATLCSPEGPTARSIKIWKEVVTPRTSLRAFLPTTRAPVSPRRTEVAVTDDETIIQPEPGPADPTRMFTVHNFAQSLTTAGPAGGIRTLRAEERAGIERAAEVLRARNNDRFNRAGLSSHTTVTNLIERPDAGVASLAGPVASLLRDVTQVFTATPEYVAYVYDMLNVSPQVRVTFGTIIEVVLEDAPVLPPNEHIRLHLALNDGLRPVQETHEAEFYCPDTWLVRKGLGMDRILVAPDDPDPLAVIADSVLRLKEDTRTLCFEPQSVATAAEDLAREDAGLAPERRNASLSSARFAPSLTALSTATAVALNQPRTNLARLSADVASVKAAALFAKQLVQRDNRISNTPTRGLVVYHTKPNALATALGIANGQVEPTSDTRASGAIRGFVVYVRQAGQQQWMSLTRIHESLRWNESGSTVQLTRADAKPPVGGGCDLGIQVCGGSEVAVDDSSYYTLTDGFLLAWDGAGLSARSPLRHVEQEEAATVEDEFTAMLEQRAQEPLTNDLEVVAARERTCHLFGVDWFPFATRGTSPELVVRRSWEGPDDINPVKLQFGAKYEFLVVAQYHNGYVPVSSTVLQSVAPDVFNAHATEAAAFERWDHIRHVQVSFREDIYSNRKERVLRREHAGESELDLVVRTGELLDTLRCVRYLLPPPIPTFQTYLWYSRSDLERMGPAPHGSTNGSRLPRTMDGDTLDRWYRRYSCNARTAQGFNDNKVRADVRNSYFGKPVSDVAGCALGCGAFCGGTQQPPVYRNTLTYLPDPVVTGIIVRFYEDQGCAHEHPLYPLQRCYYRAGNYPNLKPWELVLEKRSGDDRDDDSRNRIDLDEKTQRLTVFLGRGKKLYAKVVPMHNSARAHFARTPVQVNKLDALLADAQVTTVCDGADNIACELHGNATVFTLTHASQRPLVQPRIQSVEIRRYNPVVAPEDGKKPAEAAMFDALIKVVTEQLNLITEKAAPDRDHVPTGDIDLFAVWDDYNDYTNGPSKRIEDKLDAHAPFGGWIKVGQFKREDFATAPLTKVASGPHAETHQATITIRSDHQPFNDPRFTNISFRIRNSSTFYSYFHNGNGSAISEEDVELHSRWSDPFPLEAKEPTALRDEKMIVAAFMPNNRKPERPELRKIVGLVVRDDEDRAHAVHYRGNWVRLYFAKSGRHLTGPDRIGALVRSGATAHVGPLQEFISRAGQDIVTDGPRDVQASADSQIDDGAILWKPSDRPQEYDRLFIPTYEAAPFGHKFGVGLVSYVPQYDAVEDLWYVDLGLNLPGAGGKEIHNAFVQLGLVTYQPFSANYELTADGEQTQFRRDFRLSAPQLTETFSISPSRDIAHPLVLFGSREAGHCVLSGAVSSLFFRSPVNGKAVLRSQLVLEIQRCNDAGIWETIESKLEALVTKVNGVAIDQDAFLGTKRHLLLPSSMPRDLSARFECEVRLDFDTGFLEFKRSRRYRAAIREIELFTDSDVRPWSDLQTLLNAHDVSQVPGIRTRQVMLLTPAS